jgi:hypothetical protein
MTYLNVTQNEAVFKGRKGYNLLDKADKNFFGLNINFTPTWYQVLPGMDMLAPLSWSQGISGNSAITAGGQEGGGTFGIGIAADFYQKYRFDLKYVGFYGDIQTCKSALASTARDNSTVNPPAACAALSGSDMALPNGTFATVRDRAFIALTFKTTF